MQCRLFFITLTLLFSFFNNTVLMAKDMTLKEKIGQMLLVGFKGTELHPDDAIVQAILAQQIGGVILFDFDSQTQTWGRNIKSPKQLKHLTQQLQDYAQQANKQHKNNLTPLFIAIDYEGGKVDRLKENNGFPKTLSAAEIGQGSDNQAKHYAQQMAKTLSQVGININFAPVVDVNVNPDNPIIGKIGRSFSSDPQKVIDYAAIFSKAYQDYGIMCAYKHFPGHGSSTGDTHAGFVDVTQTWKEYELDPYKQLLNQSYACPMVLTSHVIHFGLDGKGYPASISSAITTELLRKKLHFNGIVVTDDMQMKAIADNYSVADAVRLAINAGADILVFANQLIPVPQDPKDLVNVIYDDVMTGKISESRINESYQRIMKLKEGMKHDMG